MCGVIVVDAGRIRSTNLGRDAYIMIIVKEICPRGNNKVVIYISLYHDKCLLFMLELYYPET